MRFGALGGAPENELSKFKTNFPLIIPFVYHSWDVYTSFKPRKKKRSKNFFQLDVTP